MVSRVLIVDDELPARRRLSDLLDDCRESFPLTIAGEAINGVEAVAVINEGQIDIVITDIRMPVMDGLEVARHLARMERPPKLIFATAYDQYAVQAFELNAVDYLLKPIRLERLLAALQKAAPIRPAQAEAIAGATDSKRRHLSIHERGKILLVPIEEVLYLKAELKYVTVRTAQREYLVEESLTRLEEEFGDLFTRIHRNTLVATRAVAGFERATGGEDGESGGHWQAIVRGIPERLAVSRRQQHVVKEF
ncbi:MAG TPA: LytTR family DNA-binding domain-containing protein [Usitatibacteraceae bacterium]|nr:LytTR family DNA-binding domain-containing protein [Usitatibacteraceae bacterium]